MPKYVVRPGNRFGAENQYGPGDVVELTEREYRGLEDKLVPVLAASPAPAENPSEPATPAKATTAPPVEEPETDAENAEEVVEEASELPAGVRLVAEHVGLESVEDLALLSDDELKLEIAKIPNTSAKRANKLLALVREHFPYEG